MSQAPAASRRRRKPCSPPAGTEERRFSITSTGTATLRGAGEDLVWPFNTIPDKPPTIALIKDPEQQAAGPCCCPIASKTITA